MISILASIPFGKAIRVLMALSGLLLAVGCTFVSSSEEVDATRSLAVVETAEAATAPAEEAVALVEDASAQAEGLLVTHGPISGEVSERSIVLWARGSQAGTLEFEVGSDEGVTEAAFSASVMVDKGRDFTGQVEIAGLTPSESYFYKVVLAAGGEESPAASGQFRTAPAADSASAFSFLFGSCLGGQGYCRDKEKGWFIFETMQAQAPDFFMLTGDSIYATGTCESDNVVRSGPPAEELAGFRDRYRYHLEDSHYANFLAQTPIYVTWDDHEIMNDVGASALQAINAPRFAAGVQAYFEYWPLQGTAEEPHRIYRQSKYGSHADFFILDTRSYRDPNVNWDPHPRTLEPKTMLGAEQFAWLQEGLSTSQATWKFIVTSVPLSYPTGFPQPEVDGRDGWANYTERSGYEQELMALLFYIESHAIENVIFLTGDTHWPFAISYDPDRDGNANLYEFGASPMSAITLPPPETPDPTFNPSVLYAEGEFQGNLFNFGQIAIEETGALTFRVIDQEGAERYALTLEP